MITQEAHQAFIDDVLKRYPEEACGFIIGDNYHPCKNIAAEPNLHFEIDGDQRFELEQDYGSVNAVLHSHPYKLEDSQHFENNKYNPTWPSLGDQLGYLADDVDWGIVASDGEGVSQITWLTSEIQPIESRKFSWFTADCYALVRDWQTINRGITLPNFTREYEFWNKGQNIIEEGIATIDILERIDTDHAEIGDIAVFDTFGKGIVNHLGVVTGSNEMTHQWLDRFAEVARWDHWRKHCKYVVRIRTQNAS